MPPEIVNPLRMKYVMYCVFLVLVLISAGMEVRPSVLTLSLPFSLSHSFVILITIDFLIYSSRVPIDLIYLIWHLYSCILKHKNVEQILHFPHKTTILHPFSLPLHSTYFLYLLSLLLDIFPCTSIYWWTCVGGVIRLWDF